ncbi:polygalacturonase [Thioclava sp. SK-1]|uniref:polygalacturonase PglA n=1 Tax=Thioclava sp. SK-1 TaxID=1889770 RepID=UPI0008242AC1|nr:glycoside hydrolase family 28 protein [Thioclava sp. SK-1]OCX65672.1 polygalacturonase [Thioclava sp. SK-1]
MTTIQLTALTARMAALCLAHSPARYRLDPPVQWVLRSGAQVCARGTAVNVLLLLDALTPDTEYQLDCGAQIRFRTPPCPGALCPTQFGAQPDLPDTTATVSANATAFDAAIRALPIGGTLIVPKGRWICGPLRLRSDMVLYLQPGAELATTQIRSAWPILPSHDEGGRMLGSWEGLPEPCFAGCIHAIGARNLTICGLGILDGGGTRGDWWSWPKQTRDGARRPRGMHLIDCTQTTLMGFTIRNAPSWTLHPQGCVGLDAIGLKIHAPHNSPNTDGLDPEMCEDVRIIGTHFSVGDDCIAIKSGKRGADGSADHLRPTRNILVQHCLMERGHGGLVIGSEMSGDVTDITVRDCDMIGTDRGLRLKTRRGRGGRIDRITMANIVMDGVLTAFSANAHYYCDPDGHAPWVQSRTAAPVDDTTPQIGQVQIRDVTIYNLSHALGAFLGLPEAPIGPISLHNIALASYDPTAQPAAPLMADGIAAQRHAGLCVEYATVTGIGGETAPVSLEDFRQLEPVTR